MTFTGACKLADEQRRQGSLVERGFESSFAMMISHKRRLAKGIQRNSISMVYNTTLQSWDFRQDIKRTPMNVAI